MNEILLRRKNKVIIESGNNMKPCNQYIVTLMKNVESLGYTFSKELFERLQKEVKRSDLLRFNPLIKKHYS